jgi:hypothetical protein
MSGNKRTVRNVNIKDNRESWRSTDSHSGDKNWIPGGGRKRDRSLRNFEDWETKKWDAMVDELYLTPKRKRKKKKKKPRRKKKQ